MKKRPVPTTDYTLREILKELHLDDSPCLGFGHKGYRVVVQNSHFTDDEFLAMPGWAETLWTYVRTTDEWIPVFRLAAGQDVDRLVDIELCIDPHAGEGHPGFWVTPKGLPREQYYKRDGHGNIVNRY